MKNLFLGLFLLAVAAVMSGCMGEPENQSSRPWGYRSGYDPGVPGLLNEGR